MFRPSPLSHSRGRPSHAWLQRLVLGLGLGGLLALTGLVAYLMGRAPFPLLWLACLPILCAAILFGLPGAILGATVAGLAVSPLFNSSAGGSYTGPLWLYRAGIFLGFGTAAGGLLGSFRRNHARAKKRARGLSDSLTHMLTQLAQIVEGRDERAGGHCDRVAQNAVLLGRQLGFDGRHLETLYWGALLHDLGKIAIPEKVLLKPGKLSDVEYAEVKHHPDYGADLLEAMSPEFGEIARVVRYHHERWDGGGYPKGMQAAQIPLMSRMVALADVFEALTSERPYRRPMSPESALAYLHQEAGRHFDPHLVEAFTGLYQQGEIRIAGDILLTDTIEVAAMNPPVRSELGVN